MCSQFEIRSKRQSADGAAETEVMARVFPKSVAPVVVEMNGKIHYHPMEFSLLPHWSKKRKIKFATYNARLERFNELKHRRERIYEVASWRGPFLYRRCLVPMHGFLESVRVGPNAGHMVRFAERNDRVLFAAGIYDEWEDINTGEFVESFAILTDDPPEFIQKNGHDRCPVFLNPKDEEVKRQWLGAGLSGNGKALFSFLREHALRPEFAVSMDRKLQQAQTELDL